MSIEALKMDLIKKIINTEDEKRLQGWLKALRQSDDKPYPAIPEWLTLAKELTPKTLDVEKVAREQGYDPNRLWEVLDRINPDVWADESLEDLLNSLTK